MFVDHARYRIGGGQEVFHGTAVQHEQRQFVGFGTVRATSGCHNFAKLQARCADSNVFEIVRVIVLPVDEDDFLRAASDDDFAIVVQAEVAGIEPAIGSDDAGIHFRQLEIAGSDVRPANFQMPDGTCRQ